VGAQGVGEEKSYKRGKGGARLEGTRKTVLYVVQGGGRTS